MNDLEYDSVELDRIAKIQGENELWDLENNSYVSISFGADSLTASALVDKALPGNKIPRVYFNTGIEYKVMVDFAKEMQKKDPRIVIINSGVNIKKMLEENGYPFKSKQHSHNWSCYNNNNAIDEVIERLNKNQELQRNYDYIHNLPKGIKTNIKYIFGIREKIETRNSVVERESRTDSNYSNKCICCRYDFN